MMLIRLTSHTVTPPFMLLPVAVTQWAGTRTTADWERVNGAALWQGVPGLLGARGPVSRARSRQESTRAEPYCRLPEPSASGDA